MIKNETKYDMGKTMNRYIDEFLSKIAFHAPPSHDMMSWRTVTGSGLLCTHYIVSGLPTRSDECVMSVGCCGSLKKSPYKSNKRVYANTHTPRAACLRPNLLLKIDYFLSILHRHSVSKDYLCQFLLLSILLSTSYYFT